MPESSETPPVGAGERPNAEVEAHAESSTRREVPTAPEHPVPAPGEPPGDMWPGIKAARADTDEDEGVSGIEDVALAPPGKPDGEADTRP